VQSLKRLANIQLEVNIRSDNRRNKLETTIRRNTLNGHLMSGMSADNNYERAVPLKGSLRIKP
jgi:hypothetical protein